MSSASAFAVTTWNTNQPIDLRMAPPERLMGSVDALLETVALTSPSASTPGYLPEAFLALL